MTAVYFWLVSCLFRSDDHSETSYLCCIAANQRRYLFVKQSCPTNATDSGSGAAHRLISKGNDLGNINVISGQD